MKKPNISVKPFKDGRKKMFYVRLINANGGGVTTTLTRKEMLLLEKQVRTMLSNEKKHWRYYALQVKALNEGVTQAEQKEAKALAKTLNIKIER
jgi:hypothetical protein